MVKLMTEIELNAQLEKLEELRISNLPKSPRRRTGSQYRREKRVQKNDRLMRIVTRQYVPHAGHVDWSFDPETWYGLQLALEARLNELKGELK